MNSKLLICLAWVGLLGLGCQANNTELAPSEEKRILRMLKDGSSPIDQTVSLLQKLGTKYNDNHLEVAPLLKHAVVSRFKCDVDELRERIDLITNYKFEESLYKAVTRMLDERFGEQLAMCLSLVPDSLDLSESTKDALLRFYSIMKEYPDSSLMTEYEILLSARARFEKQQRELLNTRGAARDMQVTLSLKEICDDALREKSHIFRSKEWSPLLQVAQITGLALSYKPELDLLKSEDSPAKKWSAIFEWCSNVQILNPVSER